MVHFQWWAFFIGVILLGIEAVFLDRDGTISGDGHFIHPDEFEPFENFYNDSGKFSWSN